MTEPAPQASTSTPSIAAPTVLTHLHSLLATQSSTTAALPYLHPYAPAPYKGKGKASVLSTQDQLEILAKLRQVVDDARGMIQAAQTGTQSLGDDGRAKLGRALKEVAAHQTALLPTTHSLNVPYPPSTTIPSRNILLPPVQLLQRLASSLSIQSYLEDSQFGLLKTSLALAGTCFVVDVDLEIDAVEGNEEDDEMEVDPAEASAFQAQQGQDREGKGKVRLTKITANHVKGDATGKSDWVAKALKDVLGRYLEVYNERGRDWDYQLRLQEKVDELEQELGNLKMLDLLAETQQAGAEGQNQIEWFAELEQVANQVQNWVKEESTVLFSPDRSTIFPTFRLLPNTPISGDAPIFRLRPTRTGESIPTVPGISEDIEKPWLVGSWIIEYLGDGSLRDEGLVVRRTWLSPDAAEGETNWDGLIRVEHLLYRHTTINQNQVIAPIIPFPYTSDFVHKPQVGTSGSKPLEQRFAIAEPGPEGFVVGRIGVPSSPQGLEKILQLLRAQIVLDQLFLGVFRQSQLDDQPQEDDETDAGDLDELLTAPHAIPITVRLGQSSIRLSLPIPHRSELDSTLTLTIKTSLTSPFVDISWALSPLSEDEELKKGLQTAVENAREGGGSMVDIIRRIEQCLRA